MTGLHDDLDLHDPELAHAAEVLSRSLVRFHPSFRFEERVAARLRLAGFGPMAGDSRLAARLRLAGFGPMAGDARLAGDEGPAGDEGLVAAARRFARGGNGLPALARVPAQVPLALDLATSDPALHAGGRVPRPVIVGGAIASGVSIAGAAVVAWRRLRRDA